MMDLVCVGEMLIDFLPGAEEGSYIRKAGGAPANVAVAVARNGLEVGFCGRMGNDDFGKFLVSTLRENRVRVLCPALVDEAVTTMAFVFLNGEGERSFTFARKPGADMFLTRADVDSANVVGADMVHAGSCSLSKGSAADATRYALESASKAGRLVSFDVNYRNLMWNDDRDACIGAVKEILPFVDFLKISEEEEDMLGLPPEQAAKAYNIAVLVETLGADGARCYYQGKTFTVPGRKAVCVDATGAGDAFWGGFLSCLLRSHVSSPADLTEELVRRALRYGNVAGWLCVQKKGAMESLPTTEEIQAIIEAEG
ncbi:MAG: carbohydrate kinase family protein [Oscillospiraceae bacterium]